jgi:hypothetical protein
VFSGWCQLFDYFGSGSSVELTVANTPIPPSEIGNRTFFDEGDAATAEYAREYNKILNDKMREGISNLTRERYLTFSTGAASVDEAVPKLARMRNDAEQTLAKIRSSSRKLNGQERLSSINKLLRPGAPFVFDWEQVGALGSLTAKDFVCPNVLDFKPDGLGSCYKSDAEWCQVLSMHRFGSELTDRCLAEIIDLPIPLAITIHAQPLDKAASVAFVKRRIAWMDKEIIDEQMSAVKKGYDFQILPSELKYSKEEAEDLLDHLQNKNQRLYVYTGLVYTYAPSYEMLQDRVMQIVSTARRNSIEIDALDFRQREGMNSILPLGHNHVEVSRMMTTAQVAIQMPFATQELMQDRRGLLRAEQAELQPGAVQQEAAGEPHGLRRGKAGLRQVVLGQARDRQHDPRVPGRRDHRARPRRGVQPGRRGMRRRMHPLRARVGNAPEPVRPLRRRPPVDGGADGVQDRRVPGPVLGDHGGGLQGLPEADKSIISRCVEAAYSTCSKEGRLPLLGDFYRILMQQPEAEAAQIALRYERYVKGALSFFNHESNVTFEKRITNVDFKDLSENMRAFGIIAVLETVRNRMYRNFERGVTTWLYIDEVQSLFGHPAIITYFSKFWAEGRKFNLIATGITQNSVYMLEHEEARNMVLNSDFILLHKQSPLDRKAWTDLLDLSMQEAGYIDESVRAGEGLLVAGGARVPIKDDFPKGKLYDLFNTKPEEIAALKRASKFASAGGGKGAVS